MTTWRESREAEAYRLIKSGTPFPGNGLEGEGNRGGGREEEGGEVRGRGAKIKDRGLEGRRGVCNFSIPIGQLSGNGHTCQWPRMDANEVTLCNSI